MFKKYNFWPEFYTATINSWIRVLTPDSFKEIIVDSLRFLVNNNKVEVLCFVVMSNHIHLIWQPLFDYTPTAVKSAFMKFTAHQIIHKLKIENPAALPCLAVKRHDRKFQIWQRDSLGIELFSARVFEQKLNYIHYNPVKAGLCARPEDYFYSSARFYYDGKNDFGFLRNYLSG